MWIALLEKAICNVTKAKPYSVYIMCLKFDIFVPTTINLSNAILKLQQVKFN